MGLLLYKPNTLKFVKAAIISLALFGACVYAVSYANAQGASAIRGGLDSAAGTSGLKSQGDVKLESVVGSLISSALSLVGVLLLAYLIYGGFKYMTAGGSGKGTEEAISIIKNAVIGIIIIVLAYYIADFVLSRLVEATGGAV